MKHRILSVDMDTPAHIAGIREGMYLVQINGEPVQDIIDYEHLTTHESLYLELEDETGLPVKLSLHKELYEPLGLSFESSLMSSIRTCKNHCLFCFIDQMPHGVRDTLHFKDDDWRLSLIMGNYVTLTNVSDVEFDRIIARNVSPLYVSVHATDPDVRKRIMRNPTAGSLMSRLNRLNAHGLRFHSQIVLCPGINDGSVLENSLEELYSLRPGAQSVAVVPVGLTKFREGLEPLRKLTAAEACAAIDTIEAFAQRARNDTGESFAYASDEMYIAAGRALPPYENYDGFLQLENGVGLLRRFERGFEDALHDMSPFTNTQKLAAVTGESAYGFMRALLNKLAPYGIEVELYCIRNDYFGHSITVAGLVTALDIAAQLRNVNIPQTLIIPDDMLREREDVFLDGRNIQWLSNELNTNVLPLSAADGEDFIYGLFDGLRKGEEEQND